MQVTALVSFVAVVEGQAVGVQAGEVLDLPQGVDWLQAGLVTPTPEPEPETATVKAPVETAVTRKKRA